MTTGSRSKTLATSLRSRRPGSIGLEVVDIPVDKDGLRVSSLGTDVSAVYVTPSHQYPLGGRLSVARRNELIRWARRTGATLIEDDYDSEFRYDVAPLPALAQLDLDRVVHLGTLSKMLSPALRLGWLVASPEVVDRLAAFRAETGDWPGWPMQAAFLAMLRDGYLDQPSAAPAACTPTAASTPARARRRTASRRPGRRPPHHPPPPRPHRRPTLATEARAAGVVIAPLSEYRRSTPGPPGLVIGYATPTDHDLHKALAILAPY